LFADQGHRPELRLEQVDATAIVAVAFCLGVGLWLIFFGVVVYHGWVFGSHPWTVQTRRRVFWHGIRAGMPGAWLVPGAIPMGLGSIAWGVSAWLITADRKDSAAIPLALLGFPLIFIPIFLSWRRVGWFLAAWHRTEVERELAGLEPLMPPPGEGPRMTMTRREMLFGLALAAACLVVWWVTEWVAFFIGTLNVLGLIGAMRLIDRR
jgi:hypothetical protein